MKRLIFANKLTLFKKNLLLLFFSVSVPVIILGYLSYEQSIKQIEKVSSALLENNLLQNNHQISAFITDIGIHSEEVIGYHQLQYLLEQQSKGTFNENGFINSIFPIVDELKGPYEINIFPIDIVDLPNYLQRIGASHVNDSTSWFVKALQLQGSGFWYSQTETGAKIGSSPLLYVRAIRSFIDLKPLAVVTIGIPENLIASQLFFPQTYPNFEISIIESNRNFIYPSNKPLNSPLPAFDLPVNRNGEAAGAYLQKVDDVFLALTPIDKIDWWLVATIPQKDVIGPINNIKKYSWMLIIIALTIITAFLAYITKRFTYPIRIIVGMMKRIELKQLVPSQQFLTRHDEIGQLARGYNSMVFGMERLLETTKRAEEEKRRLEMAVLINQINPHFLYNTLDSIKWRAEQAGTQTISEMVGILSNLYRFSIHDGDMFTIVEREIEHTKNYVNIELIKSNHSFQVLYYIQPSVYNLRILKLIIQPIVENAINHGVNKLEPGKGKIVVQISWQDDCLVCLVEDNGPGCEEEALIGLKSQVVPPHGGVGWYNVNRRLQVQYGIQYGLVAEKVQGRGLRVTIRYPVN